jgi:hypothetical protein
MLLSIDLGQEAGLCDVAKRAILGVYLGNAER